MVRLENPVSQSICDPALGQVSRGAPDHPSSAVPNYSAGFTLLEVLIATMVLSAVVYLTALSYSMFLNVWANRKLTDTNALNDYRSHILLRFSLESIYDYYVTDPINERTGHYYPYFKGEQDMLEFVTLFSVFSQGTPAVARLRLEPLGTDPAGRYKVIYEEASLDRTYLKYANSPPRYSRMMVVYPDVKKIAIRYYGEWEKRVVPGREDLETIYKWQSSFDGEKRNSLPEIIEFTVSTMAEDTTLVFEVRANNVFKRDFFYPAT